MLIVGRSRRRATIVAAPSIVTDAAITSVNADGFTVNYTSPPALFDPVSSPKYLVVDEPGFDLVAGSITTPTVRETRRITSRMRVPFVATRPIGGGATVSTDFLNANLATYGLLEANKCALEHFVSANAVIVGGSAVNSSTELVPKPIAQWAWPDATVVGDSLPREWLAIVAAHCMARDREEVAAVEWTITDGVGGSISLFQDTSEISAAGIDANPVIVYMPPSNVNISTLANNTTITINAKVYPHVGKSDGVYANSSILDSSQETGRNLQPQTYWRNTTRFTTPNYACIETGAVGGAVSNVKTTAESTPFPTVAAALTALRTARGGAGSDIGGDIVLLKGDVAFSAPSFIGAFYNTLAPIIVRPATGFDKTTAGFTLSASSSLSEIQGLWLNNVYLKRSGATAWQFSVRSGNKLTFENAAYDTNNLAGQVSGNNNIMRIAGLTVTGTGSSFSPSASQQCRLVRGVTGTIAAVDKLCCIGNTLTNTQITMTGVYTESGAFAGFTKLLGWSGTSSPLGFSSSTTQITGLAYVQMVVEWCTGGATQNQSLAASADDGTSSITHCVIHNCSFIGWGSAGRWNIGYNETTATPRTHKWWSVVGNFTPQINTKHDVFHAISDGQPAESPTFTGGFSILYGVGFRQNYVMCVDAANVQNGIGGAFSQAYAGIGTFNGTTSVTVTVMPDVKFKSTQQTTYNGSAYIAGAGGGDYDLNAGSPLRSMVDKPVIRFDLAGRTRPAANDTCGAYYAAA